MAVPPVALPDVTFYVILIDDGNPKVGVRPNGSTFQAATHILASPRSVAGVGGGSISGLCCASWISCHGKSATPRWRRGGGGGGSGGGAVTLPSLHGVAVSESGLGDAGVGLECGGGGLRCGGTGPDGDVRGSDEAVLGRMACGLREASAYSITAQWVGESVNGRADGGGKRAGGRADGRVGE